MRELFLFRHAKSSWSDLDLDDHDRPLNARGQRAAPMMGQYMQDNAMNPAIILCSSSVRTRQTLDLAFPDAHESELSVVYSREIYEAPPSALLQCIATVEDEISSLMLLGHNPGMQMLTLQLAKTAQGDALARIATKFPTAALARISFQAESWRSLSHAGGHLVQFITPKQLA